MKVNNRDNLKKAIKNKEELIEYHGSAIDNVIKCGLVSNILFLSTILAVAGGIISAVTLLLWLITSIYLLMVVGIVFLCVMIFLLTFLFSIKASQKISLSLGISLRKYEISKKNNIIIFSKKNC